MQTVAIIFGLSAVCVFHQGDPGDEGEIGEPGPPGLNVRSNHLHKHHQLQGKMWTQTCYSDFVKLEHESMFFPSYFRVPMEIQGRRDPQVIP